MITKLLFASPLWGLIMMAMASVAWAEPATGLTESPLYSSYTDQIVVQPALSAKVAQEKDYWSAVAGVEVEPLSTKSGDRLVLKLADKVSLVDARGIAARLLTTPGVLDAEPDVMVTPAYQPNDPLYPYQWHYLGPPQYPGGANLPPAWDLASGAGVVVAVLDSGITSHAEFDGQTLPGYDFHTGDADPTDQDIICGWHGTHVAGTIAAATDNGLGVAGVAPGAKLLPVRVLGDQGGTCGVYASTLADAIRWAAGLSVSGVPDNLYPARVLNLSLSGAGTCTAILQSAIDAAVAAGAVVVAAAGNEAGDVSGYLPASCGNVVVVGASTTTPDRVAFSNYGSLVDLSAPGTSVYSTAYANSYSYKSGTSMAAPHVAGTAALMFEFKPQWTPATVVQALVASARPFAVGASCRPGGAYAGLCGAGVLDGYAALMSNVSINQPPSVSITAPDDNIHVYADELIDFTATAVDPEDGSLNAGLSWYSDLGGPLGIGGAITKSLSVGVHLVTASVVDSGGLAVSDTVRVTVDEPPAINQPPSVTITAPADGSLFYPIETVSFAATATDPEDGNQTAHLSWYSDLDGPLGVGGAISTSLSIGDHRVTASVVDSGGLAASAAIWVRIPEPDVIITSAEAISSTGAQDGWVLESGENTNAGGSLKSNDSSSKGLLVGDDSSNRQYKSILSFDTSAIPDNATIVSARLRIQRGTLSGNNPFTTHGALWADIRTGGFNNNVALETADFQAPATAAQVASLSNATANGAASEGELNSAGLAAINKTGVTQLRLYFNLDDNNDKANNYPGYYASEYTGAAARPQILISYFVNDPPAVTIGAPGEGASFLEGSTINFSGTANDPQDGNRTRLLNWTSNLSGPIGTGGSFARTLPLGTHIITASATDTKGATGSATRTVRVRNSVPEIVITSPSNGAAFYDTQAIGFAGWADDLEQGNLTGSIVWTSDLDVNGDGVGNDQIGTGGAFSRNLPGGTHIITAAVTDVQSYTRTATVTVTVSLSPPITVTLNSVGTYDGWVLESGETTGIGGSVKSSDTTSKGLLLGDDSSNRQYKSILSFDTSSIPVTATIDSATLRILRGTVVGTSPFTTHGALLADMVTGSFNGNIALQTADFNAPATAIGVATLSSAASNGAWSEGGLNSAGLAAVNRTGVTQFRLYFTLDDNNNRVADYMGCYAGDYSAAASRPQLVVTYRQ